MAEKLRKPFTRAQDLMDRWDALQHDIRGTAREEQQAISCALDALKCPANQSGLEWNIAMSIGIYTPANGEPFARYWTDAMDNEQRRQIAEYERLNPHPPRPRSVWKMIFRSDRCGFAPLDRSPVEGFKD